jgi:antitoxin (DNA-binding transcriptional repressor) of toxin-antitoxin stability system
MVQVTTAAAQARLPELLAAAAGGERVEIRSEDGRTYRLLASRPRPPVTGVPRAGSCQGLIEVPDDWDTPLDELRDYAL